jgi:hypothetical protein
MAHLGLPIPPVDVELKPMWPETRIDAWVTFRSAGESAMMDRWREA